MYTTKLALCAVPAFLSLSLAGAAFADGHDDDDEEELEFEEAEIFFELNDTDGDLGIHALIDGDGWKRLVMEDPSGGTMLNLRVKGGLRRQGLTEIFFESDEPTFDELDPATFFRRFPEGEYEVEGRTLDGTDIEGETEVTHVMPAPAAAMVNGLSPDADCEDEEFVEVIAPVTISWSPVTMSHPDADGAGAGVQPPVPVAIHNYEVVVEAEFETPEGEEFLSVFSVTLPPDVTAVTVPEALLGLTDEFKYEVLAREESFNQTAVESCFVVE